MQEEPKGPDYIEGFESFLLPEREGKAREYYLPFKRERFNDKLLYEMTCEDFIAPLIVTIWLN